MCKKAPGPRCASHARADLRRALASGDAARIADAQEDYDSTPTGQRELKAALARCHDDVERQDLEGRLSSAQAIRATQWREYYDEHPEESPEARQAARERLHPGFAAKAECRRLYRTHASRLAAANSPATPASHLHELAQTPAMDIVTAVCKNPAVALVTLETLARSEDIDVRVRVALSPNASEALLLDLARDNVPVRVPVSKKDARRLRRPYQTRIVAYTVVKQSPALTPAVLRAALNAPGVPDEVVRAVKAHPLYEQISAQPA